MDLEKQIEEIQDREKEISHILFNPKIVDTEREKEISRIRRQIDDISRIRMAILKRNERRSERQKSFSA